MRCYIQKIQFNNTLPTVCQNCIFWVSTWFGQGRTRASVTLDGVGANCSNDITATMANQMCTSAIQHQSATPEAKSPKKRGSYFELGYALKIEVKVKFGEKNRHSTSKSFGVRLKSCKFGDKRRKGWAILKPAMVQL